MESGQLFHFANSCPPELKKTIFIRRKQHTVGCTFYPYQQEAELREDVATLIGLHTLV